MKNTSQNAADGIKDVVDSTACVIVHSAIEVAVDKAVDIAIYGPVYRALRNAVEGGAP